MPAHPFRLTLLTGLFVAAFAAAASLAAVPSRAPEIKIDGLGKGTTPLSGPWQFHTGDDSAWAQPDLEDATGSNGWEQLSADKTWGAQGYPAYVGYAWYRLHLHLTGAPGASPEFALLLQNVQNVYEIYWNGQLVAHNGSMPPHPSYQYSQAAQTFGIGQAREGVLAIRVWKAPLTSFDSDLLGGFSSAPVIGGPAAIGARKAELDYAWLRSRQYLFGLTSLYFLVFALSLLGWIRNHSQYVLLAMTSYSGSKIIGFALTGLRLPWSFNFALGWLQPMFSFADIGMWYLLLYLLQLDGNSRLARITRVLALISIIGTSLDGLITLLDWSNPLVAGWAQSADAVLTAIYTVTKVYPLVLVAFALRKHLELARWLVAGTAFLSSMNLVLRASLNQGSRYTHWTIADRINAPLFYLNGNAFNSQTIADTFLLLAIIYAVYRYMRETVRRQSALEQEFKSARELQQVLIPETLPELPGYAVTSAYRPAQEVGGDFFQIIPLEGEHAGSTLVLLGDVSGKGLKAAMTVSLIVGAVRTLAKYAPQPSELLAELNQRLWGRMQGGFTTCLALCLRPDGHCTVASAGHPAPFLNDHELDLPGALPLGLTAEASYRETAFDLREGDRFSLYTDGLLEARSASGELFSFARVDALFASRPDAAQATEAAVNFGQDDDITVLTLTRLRTGVRSTTELSVPQFALG
jgi:serine phosphatase RsbU (regulator of sigma subunit)